MLLAVHVDGLIVAESKKDLDRLGSALSLVVPVNDVGKLRWYVGRSFKQGVQEDSGFYGKLLLTRSQSASTFSRRLLLPQLRIAILTTAGNERQGDWRYREAVGSLIWVRV